MSRANSQGSCSTADQTQHLEPFPGRADQARLKQLEQQCKAEEERRQQLEQQMGNLERSHQENIRQLEAKMKEEVEKLKQETERAVQSKMREQEKLLQEGFKERSELLKKEMEQLQKEAKEQEKRLQQEFLEREKLMNEEMEQLQKEAKQREEKLQQELAELVLEQFTENKMEEAATNLTAASSLTGEAERWTGRSRPERLTAEWYMEEPVCLIEGDNKGALWVNPQAVKILETIAQPLVVVAIVGMYRTGKSYLMNALAGQRKGFSLASTVQSHTKGIWMWCLPHPRRAGHTLVLLDTEGLGDAHKGDLKHDTWIFTLGVLLSSTLVYNSKGTIDQDAMSKLHFVSELSEHIKVKADEAKEEEEGTAADTEYVSFFPSFIWTLRDFTLDLELEGKQVTEDEYLESTLMLKKGRGKEVLNYNASRECIREYFPTRKCFVFVQPAGHREVKQLESLPDSALQPEFLEQRHRFCQYVLQESRVKMLKGGHPVTGPMLGHLAQSYVETILSGKVISLEDAVTSIATRQNEAAVRAGLALYVAQMKEQVTFPAEVAALSETHGACEKAALQLFMQQSFKDEDQKYQEQLGTAINEHYSAVLSRNRTASQETCWALLSQLSADMERKLSEGVYMQPGGYQVYATDQTQVVQSFQRTPNKGVMAEQVLQQFKDRKKEEASFILLVDKMLTETEKQREADQARLEQLEQQRKAEEERRQQLEQQMRDLERSHQEKVSQMEAKMKEEVEKLRQEMARAVQCKMREQEKLLQEGFTEKADLLKKETEQLQKEAKEREKKLQQEFLERAKLMKEQVEQQQKEAKQREEKLQQELIQKRAEEERQRERQEKERQRQQEREEKERQRQHEERQWYKEEKERQLQQEREGRERERRYQHELEMQRLKNQQWCKQS